MLIRSIIADIFRWLFTISFFRKRYYGIHKRIIFPGKLFKGVVKTVSLNGINFLLHIEDWIQENLFLLGEYEATELALLKTNLKSGDTFVDIGANIGLFALTASKIVGSNGRVFAFEPFKENYYQLKKNVEINNVSNLIIEKLAISHSNDGIVIKYDDAEANKGMASSFLQTYSHNEEVDSITLDSYCQQHDVKRIDFIKIDIEGGEYPALTGMQQVLQRHQPLVLIEINRQVINTTPYSKELIHSFFIRLGYKADNWPTDSEYEQRSETNVLFRPAKKMNS